MPHTQPKFDFNDVIGGNITAASDHSDIHVDHINNNIFRTLY